MFVLVGIGLTADWSNFVFLEQQTQILKIPVGVWSPAPWIPTGLTFEERTLELQVAAVSLFGVCEFLVAPNHPLGWHLQGLYGRAWAGFGFPWVSADLVAELGSCLWQGKSTVPVAGAQQHSEHSKKCFQEMLPSTAKPAGKPDLRKLNFHLNLWLVDPFSGDCKFFKGQLANAGVIFCFLNFH